MLGEPPAKDKSLAGHHPAGIKNQQRTEMFTEKNHRNLLGYTAECKYI